MLKRLYVDNYKCLVNFEADFDDLQLLLGNNGSGKSAVFELVKILKAFVCNYTDVDSLFKANTLTRWQNSAIQNFELVLDTNPGTYEYHLAIEHSDNKKLRRVIKEILSFEGNTLFSSKGDTVKLFRDDYSEGPEYPMDWTHSGIGFLIPRDDNKKLTHFKNELNKIIVLNICPFLIENVSHTEEKQLEPQGENFASWIRYLLQEQQANMFDLISELKDVMPGFNAFKLREYGQTAREFNVLFTTKSENTTQYEYAFYELSEGQKALIVLYSVLMGLKNEGYSLFLDEPDNFVALTEIQPWLFKLQDLIGNGLEQSIIISHSPEIVNILAASKGKWFERIENGPVRIKDINLQDVNIPASEYIARGWNS